MKKRTGNFTTEAAKALKNSERLSCRIDSEGGAVYVCNGFVCYKMTAEEYAAIAQPVTRCEAGDWDMLNGEKTGKTPAEIVKIFSDAVKATAEAAALKRCPLALETQQKGVTASAWYNADKDFTALYNTKFIAALVPGFTLHTTGDKSPAIAARDNEPFALIMPIKPDERTTRAVKAYFTQPDNAAELRDDLAAALNRNNELHQLNEALLERIDELTAAQVRNAAEAAQTQEQTPPAADTKTAAEIIAARYADLAGVTVTIKGAQTAAPVVWLTGDTEKHADKIKADGAKWSGKKSAFYFRVA